MYHKFLSLNLDFIGFSTSIACAIHCALLPFLISSLPLLGLGVLQLPWVEPALITLSAILAVLALAQGYFTHHQSLVPLAVVSLGFILISLGLFVLPGNLEGVAIPLGAVIIAWGHYLNWKKIRMAKSAFSTCQNQSEK